MRDAVHVNVDKATREVLEQLSDHLDCEPGWVAGLRTEFDERLAAAADAARERGGRTAEGLDWIGGRLGRLDDAVSQGAADVARRLETQGDALDRQAAAMAAGISALSATAEAIRAELGGLREALVDLTARADRQQRRIEELTAAVGTLSRPWWKKVFGG